MNWIPVTERLPEDLQNVITWDGSDVLICRFYKTGCTFGNDECGYVQVTHWMPLPPIPNETP